MGGRRWNRAPIAAIAALGMVVMAAPAARAGGGITVDLVASASCTADGSRSITWRMTLGGLDTIDDPVTMHFGFGGEQTGVLNPPNTSNYFLFSGGDHDDGHFVETYPGGPDQITSTAMTEGDGTLTGTVNGDGYVAAYDEDDPQATLVNYLVSTSVDLTEPCPRPIEPIATTTDDTTATAVATRPAFTG